MQTIVKFRLTKAGISSTIHTAVRYGPWYLGGILLYDPFMIQGTVPIAFLDKHFWKMAPSSPLLCANLSTLQFEARRGGWILENNYHKTRQWLQIESWICEIWKFMSAEHIYIYHLGEDVSTQRTHDACLMSYLVLNEDFTISELRA